MYPATALIATITDERLRKAEAIRRAGRPTPERPEKPWQPRRLRALRARLAS
jgi:hypothetical protein